MDHCTETKKRSGQTGDQGKKVVYGVGRIRITTGIASTLKHTPLGILLTSSMTTHSILPCTKPGNGVPYPPTNVTTTRSTRKLLRLMNNKKVKPPVLAFGTEQVQLLKFDSQVVQVSSSSRCSGSRTLRMPIARYCLWSSVYRVRTLEFLVKS